MNLRPPATSVMSFPANSGAVMTYLVQTTVHFRGRLAGDEPALCNPVEELGGYDVCGRLENEDRPRDMVELSVQQSPQRAHRSLPDSSRFHIKEVVHCRVLVFLKTTANAQMSRSPAARLQRERRPNSTQDVARSARSASEERGRRDSPQRAWFVVVAAFAAVASGLCVASYSWPTMATAGRQTPSSGSRSSARTQPKLPFGTPLGTFTVGLTHVTAYSNYGRDNLDSTNHEGHEVTIRKGTQEFSGLQWECVEFARRYLLLVRQHTFESVDYAYEIFNLSVAKRVADDQPVDVPFVGVSAVVPGRTCMDMATLSLCGTMQVR